MVINKMDITLKYLKKNVSTPITVQLTPFEYFDEPEAGDLDIDSVPRYLDPRDYLDSSEELINIELAVSNNKNEKKLVIEINYFDGQQSSVATRTEYERETIIYKEIIIDMLIPPSVMSDVPMHRLARFTVENETLNCIYSALISDNDDRTQTEYKF